MMLVGVGTIERGTAVSEGLQETVNLGSCQAAILDQCSFECVQTMRDVRQVGVSGVSRASLSVSRCILPALQLTPLMQRSSPPTLSAVFLLRLRSTVPFQLHDTDSDRREARRDLDGQSPCYLFLKLLHETHRMGT